MSKTLSAISLHHNLRAYAPFTAGGKGTVRRKIVRKAKPSTAQDDKKLQGALKKLNVQPIPGVEEVNMFREDGNVLHFTAPKGELYSLFGTATPLSTTFSPVLCWCHFRGSISTSLHIQFYPLFFVSVCAYVNRWLIPFLPPLPLRTFTVHAAVGANTFAVYGAGHVKELTELVPGILNQLGPDSLASLRKLAESYQAIQQTQQRPPNAPADDDDDDVPDLVENFDAVEEKEEGEKETLDEVN